MAKRRPILMGKAERIATATEDPCPTSLTRSVLDRVCKPGPADNAHSITPKCHPQAGCSVWYRRTDGCAVLMCASCGAGVARLQLAFEVPS